MATYSGYAHLDSATGKIYLPELGSAGFLNGSSGVAVDLKATGQTTLFTVPTGLACFLMDVLVEITALSGLISAPIIRVGKAAAYTEFVGLTTLPTFTGVGNFFMLSQSAVNLIRNSFAAGEVIKVDVQTAAVGTTLTANFYPIGMLNK